MAISTISVRTDSKIKSQSEQLFETLGLNMSTAINIFLRQAIRENGIPFNIKNDEYSPRLLQAAQEAKKISRDKNVKSYSDLNQMFKDLDE